MKPKRVKVFAPATVANLGAGFDVLGVAIHKPGDVVVAERRHKEGLSFSVAPGYSETPAAAKDNVASTVASLLLKEFRPPFGIEMVLHKNMPVASGLGSSAASSVAAAVAVNALLARPLKKSELLRFALEGERKASGAPHADNAAPSLLGGACLVRSYDPLDVVQVPVSQKIVWVVVHPHLVVQTAMARAVLPTSILLRTAIRQWGNVGGLTLALTQGDVQLLGKCVEDVVAEPVRARLVNGFAQVKDAALQAGATGCTLSGSGPSMFAVTTSLAAGRRIAAAMADAFKSHAGVDSDVYISRTNTVGATIQESA